MGVVDALERTVVTGRNISFKTWKPSHEKGEISHTVTDIPCQKSSTSMLSCAISNCSDLIPRDITFFWFLWSFHHFIFTLFRPN